MTEFSLGLKLGPGACKAGALPLTSSCLLSQTSSCTLVGFLGFSRGERDWFCRISTILYVVIFVLLHGILGSGAFAPPLRFGPSPSKSSTILFPLSPAKELRDVVPGRLHAFSLTPLHGRLGRLRNSVILNKLHIAKLTFELRAPRAESTSSPTISRWETQFVFNVSLFLVSRKFLVTVVASLANTLWSSWPGVPSLSGRVSDSSKPIC